MRRNSAMATALTLMLLLRTFRKGRRWTLLDLMDPVPNSSMIPVPVLISKRFRKSLTASSSRWRWLPAMARYLAINDCWRRQVQRQARSGLHISRDYVAFLESLIEDGDEGVKPIYKRFEILALLPPHLSPPIQRKRSLRRIRFQHCGCCAYDPRNAARSRQRP